MLTEGLNTLESHQPRALPTKLKLNWRCPAINEVGDFLDYVKPTTRNCAEALCAHRGYRAKRGCQTMSKTEPNLFANTEDEIERAVIGVALYNYNFVGRT